MSDIPTDEEFERASKMMEDESRHLDEIKDMAIQYFKKRCPLYGLYIMPQIDVDFRVYVFLDYEKDIADFENNGGKHEMQQYIYDKLEYFGKGKKNEISVAFEIDSNENVIKNYDGDYFIRLR